MPMQPILSIFNFIRCGVSLEHNQSSDKYQGWHLSLYLVLRKVKMLQDSVLFCCHPVLRENVFFDYLQVVFSCIFLK